MKMTPTTLDRKARKKWLTSPALAIVLALLLVLSSLPVYAGEQQTEQTETPTVTQDAGSESAQSATSSEPNEPLAEELEPVQPIEPQEPEVVATDWTQEKPHEGQVLHGGYVGFRNVASGKYLTVSNGNTTEKPNVIQYDEVETPNAQEFLLEYTYSQPVNEAYFRIFSLTANGIKSNPVKSVGSTATTSNVRIDSINYLSITDRWQIEHAYGSYYYIYLAHNPAHTGTKYALTAYGDENGTTSGTTTTSQGNVFVSPLVEGNDYQLWEICADGMPMDIESNDITENRSYELNEGETIKFFYIPYRFNESLSWQSSNTYSVSTPTSLGRAAAEEPGRSTIAIKITIDDLEEYVTSQVYVKLPDGVYYLRNRSTGLLLDLDKDHVSDGTPIQVYNGGSGEPTNYSQLYKFNYLGNGLYSIRSMRKNNMGVSWSYTNQSATIKDIGTSNTSVPDTGQWYLNRDVDGYYLSAKTSTSKTITVPLNAVSGTNLVVQSYAEGSNQAWTITAATQNYSEVMLTDSFDELLAQCSYDFDVWYVTSDTSINGSAVVSWEIEQDENVIERGSTTNSFNTLIPGEAELRFTVTNAGSTISSFTTPTCDVVVGYPTPSEGDWFMENASSGQYASTNGQTNLGSSMVQTSFNDHAITEWEFEHVTQNYFRIISKATGLYLTAPSSIISPVMQESLDNDNSLWKIEKTSGNRYKITSKAYETSNYVLAIFSSTIGNLYLCGYVDDTNYNDEWHLNISGSELTILAVADNNITRSVAATNAESDAEEKGVDVNLIISRHTSTQAVLYGMKTSEVFVSRSHGSSNSIAVYSLEEGRTYPSLLTSDIYNYNTETVQFDLNGCDLVVLIGCSTAADEDHHSIADAVVKAGAGSAIGFEETLNAAQADTWMEAFLEAYYNEDNLLTYKNVGASIEKALYVESDGGLDSCRLIP